VKRLAAIVLLCGCGDSTTTQRTETFVHVQGNLLAGEGVEVVIDGVEIRSAGSMTLEMRTRTVDGERVEDLRTLGGLAFEIRDGEFRLGGRGFGPVVQGDVVLVDDEHVAVNGVTRGDVAR